MQSRQCQFTSESKPFLLRTTEEKRDLLRVAAARRRKSVNKMMNDWIDSVIQEEDELGKQKAQHTEQATN